MLRWHRWCAALSAALLLYVIVTGLGIQVADLRALVSHAPETDPDMLMMRQHIDGPPNFAVVSAPDYAAPPLPADLDYPRAIERVASLGHARLPGRALRLVELRSVAGRPAGHVQMGSRHLIFDLATGMPLPPAGLPPPEPDRDFQAPRASFKYYHRFLYLGGIGPALNGLAAVALVVMLFTGLAQAVRVYRSRARLGRRQLFWRGRGGWRTDHEGRPMATTGHPGRSMSMTGQ